MLILCRILQGIGGALVITKAFGLTNAFAYWLLAFYWVTLVVEGRVEASMDSRVIQIAENGVFSGTVSIDVAGSTIRADLADEAERLLAADVAERGEADLQVQRDRIIDLGADPAVEVTAGTRGPALVDPTATALRMLGAFGEVAR